MQQGQALGLIIQQHNQALSNPAMEIKMKDLELKIPPLILLLLLALVMVELDQAYPLSHPQFAHQSDHAVIIGAIGAGISLWAYMAFQKFDTPLNASTPDVATKLVISGVYKYSRNPMYLGFFLVLVGVALLLANPVMWAGPVVFILFITRFQILPEERALQHLFGDDYSEYCQKTRRWI